MGDGLAAQTDNHHTIDVRMAGKARQHLLAHVGIGLHVGTARVEHDVYRLSNLTGHDATRLTSADARGQNQDMVTDARTTLCATVAPELEGLSLAFALRLYGTHLPVISSQFAVIVTQLTLQIMVVHPATLSNSANEPSQTLAIFNHLATFRKNRQRHLMAVGDILLGLQRDTFAAIHVADILPLGNLRNRSHHVIGCVHQQCVYLRHNLILLLVRNLLANIR